MSATRPISLSPELWNRLSTTQRAAVMDAARERAHQLRTEALDEFAMALRAAVRGAWRTLRGGAPAAAPRPVARA